MHDMTSVENGHKDDGDKQVEIPKNGISTENSETANENTHSGSGDKNNNNTAAENTHSDNDDENLIDWDLNDDYTFDEVTNWLGPIPMLPRQATPVEENEEERPIIYYDEENFKYIEIFRSTRQMRWWDAEKGEYVPYYSQAIDDWLNKNDVYHSEDEEDGVEDELWDGEEIWNY